MFAWDYPLRFWRISQNWQFTSMKPWGLPHSSKSDKKINKTYKTTTHQLEWWVFFVPFSQTSTLQTIFHRKFMDLTLTILPGLAGTVAQLRVLKDASLSHEELISGLKAQIRSEGRQVAFPSVTLMILMDPKSCVFLFAIVVRLGFCFFFSKIAAICFFCAWKCGVYVCASTYW